jgi:LPS-assembly protein
MLKLLLLFIFVFTSLAASDKVEIYASSLQTKDDIIEASDGVSVVYKGYFLSAQSAIYNRTSGDLELFDNVRVNHGTDYKVLGKYAKLNIAKKEKLFEPFYMLEKKSKVWISARKGESKNEDIAVTSGVLSGCNPVDPLWTLEFSSSDYNSESKWMNIYNARLYISDIPVFYTPYFGYSLDTTRRTGLLMPSIGLSQSEGVYYEQPLYIAEYDSWDLELTPQMRSTRGEGVYETFRFVDGKNSNGEFTAGYFREKNNYFIENSLQNDSHYGFNFKYDNNDFMNQWLGTHFGGQSGLYVDINHMNDVDYINLNSNNPEEQATATQVLSRINMFYNTENHYVGAYFKYYQDLTQVSNDTTPQKLPTLQYHYYLDTFLKDHVLYSLDVQSNNIIRKLNTNVIQTDINLPVTLQTSLFDEYLNVEYRANLYMQHSKFSGTEEVPVAGLEYKNGYYARNYHTLSGSTQLTRGYDLVSHVMGLGVSYNRSGSDTKTGFYEDYIDANQSLQDRYEFYKISDIQDEVKFDFIQYLYDSSANQLLYHRMTQKLTYTDTEDKLGELENELDFRITDAFHFYNNMFYNYDQGLFSKIFNRVSYSIPELNIALSHLYKDSFEEATVDTQRYTSYLTSTATYNYSKHFSYSAVYNYDLQTHEKKNMGVGFMYKKRCWDFGVRYSENNRPVLTNTGVASSVYDKYIYITLVLKPLMQSNSASSFLTYKLPENQ